MRSRYDSKTLVMAAALTAAAAAAVPSSSTPGPYCPGTWSDLPDELLHLILLRLCHFRDLLAFSSACRSWRSLARSTASASPSPLFPPLLIRPLLQLRSRRRRRLPVSALHMIDPAGGGKTYCSPIEESGGGDTYRSPIEESFLALPFLSSSHGQLLFLSAKSQVIIVDFFTGCKIVSPALPQIDCRQSRWLAQLTAPVSSPNCTLVLLTVNYLFLWKVNSPDWNSHRHTLCLRWLRQMVVLETRIWVMLSNNTISILELPQDSCSELLVMQWEWWKWDKLPGFKDMRLVDCGGEILGVCFVTYDDMEMDKVRVEVFQIRLMGNNRLMLVKKTNIGNRAVFLSDAVYVPGKVCDNPKRWGGKGNCVYYALSDDEDSWYVLEVGQITGRSLFFREANRSTCSFPFWDFASALQ